MSDTVTMTKRKPTDYRLVLYVDRETVEAIQRIRAENEHDGLTASISQVIRVAVRQYIAGRAGNRAAA